MRRTDLLGGPEPEGPAPREAMKYGTVIRYDSAVVMVIAVTDVTEVGLFFSGLNLVTDGHDEGFYGHWFNAHWEVVE